MRLQKTLGITLIVGLTLTSGIVFGYSFDNAVESLGPGANGRKSGAEMTDLWYKMSAKLKFGRKADAFLKFLNKVVQEFDWRQLYESKYLSGRRAGYRTITFQALNLPNQYKVDIIKGSYASVPMSKLGNVGSEYGLRHNKTSIVGDESYSGYLKLRAALKQFNHENGAAFLTGLAKIVSPENLPKLSAPGSRIYANMGGHSRKVLNELHRHLPRFSRTLAKYTSLKSLVKIKEYKGKRYTHLKMVGGLRMKNFKKDFGEIYDYLEDVEGMLKFRFIINNKNGNRVMTFSLDSKRRMIVWSLYTSNGKIIPFDYKRRPVFKDAFELSAVKKYTFYNIMNAKIAISGLRIYTGNIIVRGSWKKTSKQGRFYFHVTKIPKPKITGRLYHVIPTWLIDVGIPGNIESLAGSFTKVMEKGNNGKGTRIAATWNVRRPRDTIFTVSASSEFIDNRFIRFALRIWSKKMRPGNKALDELTKVQGLLTGKLKDDLKQLAGT